MARTSSAPPNRVHHVFSLSAKVVTAAAALATVLGYVHSVGLDGSMTRRTIGSLGAVWLGLAPAADTATAIGDTVHLAATVTDRHGTALIGAPIIWSSTDSLVASVADGLVVAHSAGSATIVAAVGDLLARATVVVRPRVAALHLASDSAVTLAEGETRAVSLRGADARGHVLPSRCTAHRLEKRGLRVGQRRFDRASDRGERWSDNHCGSSRRRVSADADHDCPGPRHPLRSQRWQPGRSSGYDTSDAVDRTPDIETRAAAHGRDGPFPAPRRRRFHRHRWPDRQTAMAERGPRGGLAITRDTSA